MVITKPKTKSTDATDTFISGAPDSGNQAKGVRKGNKRQISLTITPALLDRVDELATRSWGSLAQRSSTWRFIVLLSTD